MTKEVARTVYKKYLDGGPIEISYVTSNPYHVFVRDYSVGNLIDTLLYMKILLYSLTIVGLIGFIVLFWYDKRKHSVSLT